MCLATPMKIVKTEGDWAVVSSGGKINISLIKNAEIGDYILAHGGMAINKVDKDEAERILKIIEGGKK